MPKSNLHEVRETKMPAVLLELGFMDSATDVPVILTDKYADQCAAAIVDVLVKRGKLTKKVVASNKLYRVQTGAFKSKPNAEKHAVKLKAAGFDSIIVESEV
jgi:N-acetylmuramoyl-L-alanine amidase